MKGSRRRRDIILSSDARKPVIGIPDSVCAATEDGYKVEIFGLGKRGIALSV